MARSFASGLVTGLVVSAGAALLSPLLARWSRPVIKTAIKSGVTAYEVGRGRVSEVGEYLGDLAAEAHFEMLTERAAADSAPDAASVRTETG